VARRTRAAVDNGAAAEDSRIGGALALEPRVDDVPLGGPYDGDDMDPEITDAAGVVDFGAVRVPVPPRGTVAVEPTANGRMQAVHVALPEGRLSVSALAAPKSSKLWPELAREIDASLREGGATVRSFPGPWGRELHATSGGATSLFVGVDGPRWMLYGVATGPTAHADVLDVELRRMLRAIVVVRGRAPYPVRTVLPLVVPDHVAEAMAASAASAAAPQAAVPTPPAALTDQVAVPPAAAAAPPGAREPLVEQPEAARPPIEDLPRVRPQPGRPRQPARPAVEPAAPAPADRERDGRAQPPPAMEREDASPLWADPVRRIADADDAGPAGQGFDAGPDRVDFDRFDDVDFDNAPTEIWAPLPPDPADQVAEPWRPDPEPDLVQGQGDRRRTADPVPPHAPAHGGVPTQPWTFEPRAADAVAPDAWAFGPRTERPEPVRGWMPGPEPAAAQPGAAAPDSADLPTDPWPLASRYRAEPAAEVPAEPSWSLDPAGHRHAPPEPALDADGSAATPGDRLRGPEESEPRTGRQRALAFGDSVSSTGTPRTLGAEYLIDSGAHALPSGGGRRRAPEPTDDAAAAVPGTGRRRAPEPEPLTWPFGGLNARATEADSFPAESGLTLERPRGGRHSAPESAVDAPETMPLRVYVAPPEAERPSGRHRRPD
jgi:hypothetical protein